MSNENEWDVWVARDVLVFVERREKVSSARQFGIEWDGPQCTALHPAVFNDPPAATTAASLEADVARAVAALSVRERVALAVRLNARGVPWWCVWLVVFCALGALAWWKR